MQFDATVSNPNPFAVQVDVRLENPAGAYVVGTRREIDLEANSIIVPRVTRETLALHAVVVGTGLPAIITYIAAPGPVRIGSFSFSATKIHDARLLKN